MLKKKDCDYLKWCEAGTIRGVVKAVQMVHQLSLPVFDALAAEKTRQLLQHGFVCAGVVGQ